MPTSEELRERITLRLDESFVGISLQVADLPAADLIEPLNQLKPQRGRLSIMSRPKEKVDD